MCLEQYISSRMPRQQLSDILDQMRRYCVTQDRCHSEVRSKLLKKEVYGDDLEEILSQLVSEDFLNEERFARSYVRGKFRMNRWGRFKIRMMLKQKRVSDYCIDKGMNEIDEEEYITTIDELLVKKLRGATDYASRQKAKASVVQKGYEPWLVGERLAELPREES